MPTAADLGTSNPTLCSICGRELGAGPWWMIEPGRGAHESCAPWAQRPFPYREWISRLRSRRARLRHALEALDAAIDWAERAQKHWPKDAHAILAKTREWQRALERRLEAGGVPRSGTR